MFSFDRSASSSTPRDPVVASDDEVATFREGLAAERDLDCRQELVKARLAYAESGSTDARLAYVFYLLKSERSLDVSNAQFHLLEMLQHEPLDRQLLYSLALAHYKLAEYTKCDRTLDAFFDVPDDSAAAVDAAADATGDGERAAGAAVVPSALERKAACLRRECARAARNEQLKGAAVAGAALTGGVAGLAVGAFVLLRALKK